MSDAHVGKQRNGTAGILNIRQHRRLHFFPPFLLASETQQQETGNPDKSKLISHCCHRAVDLSTMRTALHLIADWLHHSLPADLSFYSNRLINRLSKFCHGKLADFALPECSPRKRKSGLFLSSECPSLPSYLKHNASRSLFNCLNTFKKFFLFDCYSSLCSFRWLTLFTPRSDSYGYNVWKILFLYLDAGID